MQKFIDGIHGDDRLRSLFAQGENRRESSSDSPSSVAVKIHLPLCKVSTAALIVTLM